MREVSGTRWLDSVATFGVVVVASIRKRWFGRRGRGWASVVPPMQNCEVSITRTVDRTSFGTASSTRQPPSRWAQLRIVAGRAQYSSDKTEHGFYIDREKLKGKRAK